MLNFIYTLIYLLETVSRMTEVLLVRGEAVVALCCCPVPAKVCLRICRDRFSGADSARSLSECVQRAQKHAQTCSESAWHR